ncbi:MAG: tryptophan--tRNA ligase [Verrucomicrobiota bacterium]|nr:tryptophan--tRNA ligase [Verrucomicrobiota bacterium]
MPRILSGIKPTGPLHIGNYFGVMRPAIEWQDRGEAFYFVADYHALTTLRDPAALRDYSHRIALDFLACGLDPEKAVLFRQSDVPEVTELTWILTTVTPMPMLQNSHAFKDHLAKGGVPSHGLFAYPVLMAADILLYDSDIVPVGKDQKQHVEITRDIAAKMNEFYGPILKIPEASILPQVATISGLDGRKMSKSYGNTIELFCEEKVLRKKIMSIVTDSTPVEAPKNPQGSSILDLFRLFADVGQVGEMEAAFRTGGVGYGEFKRRLSNAIWNFFAPMREKRAQLAAQDDFVSDVLAAGAKRARVIASRTMDRVRMATGLR